MTLESESEPEPEQLLYKYETTKGWIRKRVTGSYLLSNRRVVVNNQVLQLEDVSECVSLNEERVYDGEYISIGTHSRHSSYRIGLIGVKT